MISVKSCFELDMSITDSDNVTTGEDEGSRGNLQMNEIY